jgi:inorganic pyrophosphatase
MMIRTLKNRLAKISTLMVLLAAVSFLAGLASSSYLLGPASPLPQTPIETPLKYLQKLKDPLTGSPWYAFIPGKFAGSVAVVDLSVGETVAWLPVWAYGDPIPIVHHAACLPAPSGKPNEGFECFTNTQGGKNLYIYGVQTEIEKPAEGFKIYKIKYDGVRLTVKDVSEKIGMGLGVHITVSPDAKLVAVADGQKDIVWIGRTDTLETVAAFRFNWSRRTDELIIERLSPNPSTGRFNFEGSRGLKIDWELAPGQEYTVDYGKVTGASPENVTALDAIVFNPKIPIAAATLRRVGLLIIFDTRDWVPVGVIVPAKDATERFIQAKGLSGHQHGEGKIWGLKFKRIAAIHQAGFDPTGRFLLVANKYLRDAAKGWDGLYHDLAVIKLGIEDPGKDHHHIAEDLERHLKEPGALGYIDFGEYEAFHMGFLPDGGKVYISAWAPPPRINKVAVIDTRQWKIVKWIDIGPDVHTAQATYDGKWVVVVYSGYQKTRSGIAIIETSNDEVVARLNSPYGHHDHVIVPRNVEDLKISRSTTT